MRNYLWLSLALLFIGSNAHAVSPYDDIGCVLSKVSGNDVIVSTKPATRAECKKGSDLVNNFGESAKACATMGLDDPSFSNSGSEARSALCKKCGYLWIDNACVVEDKMGKMEEKIKTLEEKFEEEETEAQE